MHYDLRYYELKHIRKGITQVVKFLLICQTHNFLTFTFFIQHQKNLSNNRTVTKDQSTCPLGNTKYG